MFSRIRIGSPAFFSHFCRKESLKLGTIYRTYCIHSVHTIFFSRIDRSPPEPLGVHRIDISFITVLLSLSFWIAGVAQVARSDALDIIRALSLPPYPSTS